MNQEIEIQNIKATLSREFLNDRSKIDLLLEGIRSLSTLVFDFNDEGSIKEAKLLKTKANRFIKDFKEFCDPLEEEGKMIGKTRSEIKLTLEGVIDSKLQPIAEREEKLKDLRNKILFPIPDLAWCDIRLGELEKLESYEWLAFKAEAAPLLEQYKTIITIAKNKFLEEERLKKEIEAKERAAREERIRIEAEERVKINAQREIDEANKRAAQAEVETNKLKTEVSELRAAEVVNEAPNYDAANKAHRAKINNEILSDIVKHFAGLEYIDEDFAKKFITAIAKNQIRHLRINY